MSTSAPAIAALLAASLLFLLQLGLSVALVAVSALSRVALRRLSNGGTRLAFIESMRDTASSHRMAAALMRLLALFGGISLVLLAARSAGWAPAAIVVAGVSTLGGVLLLDLLVPRLVALWDPRSALRRTAFLVRAVHAVLYPAVRPLALALSRLGQLQEVSDEERDDEQDEEVEAFIEVGEREGILEAEEGEMMRSIVDLDETVVREIMTPRTDIVALPVETTLAEARRRILETGHSRLPVYRESLDEVLGVLHERDLLRAWEESNDAIPIAEMLRESIFIPETRSVSDLLADMRLKSHFALVVDEYGGVSGLVTLEDVLEEIVGDIREEHEREEELVQPQPDGSWIINAAAHVEELEELFGLEFAERDFDTVGGLVVASLGRVPARGETVQIRTLEIEVLEAEARRIRLVRVRPRRSSEAGAQS